MSLCMRTTPLPHFACTGLSKAAGLSKAEAGPELGPEIWSQARQQALGEPTATSANGRA